MSLRARDVGTGRTEQGGLRAIPYQSSPARLEAGQYYDNRAYVEDHPTQMPYHYPPAANQYPTTRQAIHYTSEGYVGHAVSQSFVPPHGGNDRGFSGPAYPVNQRKTKAKKGNGKAPQQGKKKGKGKDKRNGRRDDRRRLVFDGRTVEYARNAGPSTQNYVQNNQNYQPRPDERAPYYDNHAYDHQPDYLY